MINGWQTPSDFTIDSLIAKFLPDGLKRICVTSIKCDGMLQGPDTELYKRLVREYPGLKVTASGGVSSVDDLIKLQDTGVDSAIVGKAIYEKKISLNELAQISEC
jgi:phosphoribosylformimino-5-aminoimidazole carboxamide ribotide isomerase